MNIHIIFISCIYYDHTDSEEHDQKGQSSPGGQENRGDAGQRRRIEDNHRCGAKAVAEKKQDLSFFDIS